MILIWSLLSFTFWNSSPSPEQRFDFSCATFHPFLTETELIAKFGSENVTSGPVVGADDGQAEGTILFANRDDMKVEILWPDAARKQNPSWIRVSGERGLWQTPNGLKLGEDLRTIERRNGFPFRLAGFTSERHGDLRDWGIGRLGNIPNCNIGITFQPRPGTGNPSLIRQVTRRSLVSSGHPAMQEINPQVVALWIRYPIQRSPTNADDALLDVLVFGIHMPIDPTQYPPELRSEVQQYLRRAVSYNPKRAVPSSGEMGMVYAAQIGYETRLVANSDDPKAPALAQDYVTRLRPCYEWEGFHDCPERDARFADEYQAANPNGPFSNYLPLLAAHRWLCAAEGYDYEKNAQEAERSRRLYEQRLSVARQSKVLLLRTAADRLAARGQCLSRK